MPKVAEGMAPIKLLVLLVLHNPKDSARTWSSDRYDPSNIAIRRAYADLVHSFIKGLSVGVQEL